MYRPNVCIEAIVAHAETHNGKIHIDNEVRNAYDEKDQHYLECEGNNSSNFRRYSAQMQQSERNLARKACSRHCCLASFGV